MCWRMRMGTTQQQIQSQSQGLRVTRWKLPTRRHIPHLSRLVHLLIVTLFGLQIVCQGRLSQKRHKSRSQSQRNGRQQGVVWRQQSEGHPLNMGLEELGWGSRHFPLGIDLVWMMPYGPNGSVPGVCLLWREEWVLWQRGVEGPSSPHPAVIRWEVRYNIFWKLCVEHVAFLQENQTSWRGAGSLAHRTHMMVACRRYLPCGIHWCSWHIFQCQCMNHGCGHSPGILCTWWVSECPCRH